MDSKINFYNHYYPTGDVSLETLEEVWSYVSKTPLPKSDKLMDTSNFLSHVKAELITFHSEEWVGTVDFYDESDADELIQIYSDAYNKLLEGPIRIKLYACRVNELNYKFDRVLSLIKDRMLRNYVNTSVRDARLKFIGDVPSDGDPNFFGKVSKLQMNCRSLIEDIKTVRLFPKHLDEHYHQFVKGLSKIPEKMFRSLFDDMSREGVISEIEDFLRIQKDIGATIEMFFSYSFMRELTKHDEIPFITPKYMSEDEVVLKSVEFDLNFDLNDFYKFVIAVLKLKRDINRPMTTKRAPLNAVQLTAEPTDFYDRIYEINQYSHIFKYELQKWKEYI